MSSTAAEVARASTSPSCRSDVLGTSVAAPIEWVRQKHHIKDGNGDFSFGIIETGLHQYGYAGEDRLFDAGSAGFVDLGQPWRSISEAASWNVTIPEATLKALVPHPEDLAGRPVQPGPAVRLLKGYLRSLAGLKEPLPPDLAQSIGVHLLDLVAAALGPTVDAAEIVADRGIKAARMREIRAKIERRCSEPGFNLDRVAADLGLSRRYVQKLLEETGKPEPETRALVSWLDDHRPVFVLSLHSWKPLLITNGSCQHQAAVVAKWTGYSIQDSVGLPTRGAWAPTAGVSATSHSHVRNRGKSQDIRNSADR
jgi:hypothetical protein